MELTHISSGQVGVTLFTSDLLALYLACKAAASDGFRQLGATHQEQHRRAVQYETWAGFFLAAAYGTEAGDETMRRLAHRRHAEFTLTELLTQADEQDWRPLEERPAEPDQTAD